ncbi:MAG TPA: hypothetical protein VGL71_01225 [Urbifossiella sp.]|jgi:hypothetical protein
MLASRRTCYALLIGLAIGPMPACIHVSETVSSNNSAPVKSPRSGEFATLPKRPGEVIRKAPEASTTAAKPPASTEPAAPTAPASPIADANVVTAAEPSALPTISIPSANEPSLLAALRAYLDNRPEDAIRLLQSFERSNQDFALALLPLLVRATQMKMSSANPEEVAVMVDQLHSLAGRLETKAALKVEKVTFYRKFEGFGRYEPWPEAQPYRPNDLALLYFEVRNVGSESVPGPGGENYLSRATVSLEVRDAAGKLVEQTDPADWRCRVPVARFQYVDRTRSPLHDYYRTYRISVPTQPGVYTVTVEVKDPASNRVARSTPVRFDVAGP